MTKSLRVGEEASETIIAKNKDNAELKLEISDLIYHLLVLLQERKLLDEMDHGCAAAMNGRAAIRGLPMHIDYHTHHAGADMPRRWRSMYGALLNSGWINWACRIICL